MFFPNILTVPPSMEISPNIALKVVLFPEPFCPIRPVIQPGAISNEQSNEKFP